MNEQRYFSTIYEFVFTLFIKNTEEVPKWRVYYLKYLKTFNIFCKGMPVLNGLLQPFRKNYFNKQSSNK